MSDDTPEFKQAQSNHALKVKVNRRLAEMTGLTPNQIRQRMHGNSVEFLRQVGQSGAESNGRLVVPERPTTKHSAPQILPPRPLSETNREPAVVVPPNSKTDKKVIITDNGTANYYLVPAEFAGAV